jgi:ketosteroid isomerase-like protein
MTNTLQDWMAGYRRAWESNDPDDIRALFTDDALYYTAPFRQPSRGIDAIIEMWLDRKDEPGDNTFEWHELLQTEDVVIVQGETDYKDVAKFSNLWLIRFAESGRATEFTEWWMDHDYGADT